MALAVGGGHRECVELLRAAGWPARRPATDGEDSRGTPPADDGPGDGGEDGVQTLPEGGGGCGEVSDGDEERGRSSSLPDERAETSAATGPSTAIGGGAGGGGENQRHDARAAPPPACRAQKHLPPATTPAVESPTSLWCHSVAARTPSGTLRSPRRVLSMDMALPGLRPKGTTPSYLQELLEAPVLQHTPRRQRSPDSGAAAAPAAGGEQVFGRSTASCSGATTGPQAAAAEGPEESFCLENWRWWLSEGANNGIGDSDNGERLRGFLEAGKALAAGGRSTVRDIWSPVSGAAGALEV